MNKCLCHFYLLKKSREIPEDSVDKSRNGSELKLISLKKTCINCWLIKMELY
jgi:hypothetical protein